MKQGPEPWIKQQLRQGAAWLLLLPTVPFALALVPSWLWGVSLFLVVVVAARQLARFVARRKQRW